MTTLTLPRAAVDLVDCGDSALRVAVTSDDPAVAWRVAHSLAGLLEAEALVGLHCVIPTYDAALIEFDCELVSHDRLRTVVAELADRLTDTAPRAPRSFTVPVVYGGELGPDLEATAQHLSLTPDDVIAIHTAHPLVMRCFGSPGGAPMMDGPDFPRPIPRLASPRPHVPAGAAAVAGRQAVISARPAPGGWQVLGTTPVTVVAIDREPISAFWPGDRFQFTPIPESEFDAYRGMLS